MSAIKISAVTPICPICRTIPCLFSAGEQVERLYGQALAKALAKRTDETYMTVQTRDTDS